ncbi:MAG: hypothetical protein SPL49_05600 [Oribacterium sp.]|nr:hypothetical protein [Oribacterium sp.]MDY6307047.1 hypothetical protein [Oribacterium sp.]MDY6316676.1 hypothetical protein [Oribacterium sp.]
MTGNDPVRRTTDFIAGLAFRAIIISALIYAVLIGISMAYRFGHGLLYDHAMEEEPGHDVTITITKGEDVDTIAEDLIKLGLIDDNVRGYKLKSKLYEASYEPGTYTLNTSMTAGTIIATLTEEGKKNQELEEKNLIDADAPTTEAATAETDENGITVIGGNMSDG